MEPSDVTVSSAAIVATFAVCFIAPVLRSRSTWLPQLIQSISGFVIPPAIVAAAFHYWGGIRGDHNSLEVLLAAWFVCVIAGLAFSRRVRRDAEEDER